MQVCYQIQNQWTCTCIEVPITNPAIEEHINKVLWIFTEDEEGKGYIQRIFFPPLIKDSRYIQEHGSGTHGLDLQMDKTKVIKSEPRTS
jgi:hypothetical protein